MSNDALDQLLGSVKEQVKLKDTGEWLRKEQQLLDSCHPKQRLFVEDPGRRVVALTSRGCGKTTGGLKRFVRRMLRTPKAKCLFVATTRVAAKLLIWNALKDELEKLEIDAIFNETELSCTFIKNKANLRIVGADDAREIEKQRGLPHHEVGIDEGASHDPKLLDHFLHRIVGPRLGDYGGMIWMIGTPGTHLGGPFYEATRPDSKRNPAWNYHYWTLQDGAPYVREIANNWQEAQVEKQANGWDDNHPVWRREYLGQWAADDTENVYKYRAHNEQGEPWNIWGKAKGLGPGLFVPQSFSPGNSTNPFGLPENLREWRYIYGMDMGHSDPFALQVFAYSPYSHNLYQVYEYTQKGMYANTIAKHLLGEGLSHEHPEGVMKYTGWPDGMVADLAQLGNAICDEMRNVYGLPIEPAEKKNKFDAIELFNGDLLQGRVKILQGSKLEQELMTLQWDVDEWGTLKEKKGHDNHCTDAAVYARRKAYHQFAIPLPSVGPTANTPEYREREALARIQRVEAENEPREQNEFEFVNNDESYEGWWK